MNSPQSLKSLFNAITLAPPDPLLGVTEAFIRDTHPQKVNLGVGVYQDHAGGLPILESVKAAEGRILRDESTKNYLPLDGDPVFRQRVQELLFGENASISRDGKAVTVQAAGGTGALKIAADLLRAAFPDRELWISDPSWENHRWVFEAAGFKVSTYRYYDPTRRGLDFLGMRGALETAPPGTIIVLHACCHNPTGFDPTHSEWEEVRSVFEARSLVPLFDFAYQGFGDGLIDDAYAVRAFAFHGIPTFIAQSFSKNFGLYRERVGALTVTTGGEDESRRILSQLKRRLRAIHSSPPSHGAQVVSTILGAPELRHQWEAELETMRVRIHAMRRELVDTLRAKGCAVDFSFVVDQKGMFSYPCLSQEMTERFVAHLRTRSVYIPASGRLCIAALNAANLGYVCDAVVEALTVT